MVEQGQDVDTDGPVTWADPANDVRPAGRTLADQLLDGAGSGILAHDDQGVIRFLNATASALLPKLRVGELLVGALDPRAVDPADGRATSGAHAPCEVELTAGGSRLHARRHALSARTGSTTPSVRASRPDRCTSAMSTNVRRVLAGPGGASRRCRRRRYPGIGGSSALRCIHLKTALPPDNVHGHRAS